MKHLHFQKHQQAARAQQRGLTLIEFMVSIAIGMLMIAALAALIADQSGNRAEVDKAGRMIENGRYAIRTLADDVQLAGYWGELTDIPAAPGAWVDPCGADPVNPTVTEMEDAIGLHVTGFDVPSSATKSGYNAAAPMVLPVGVTLSCLPNLQPGTDVLVVRRVEPDTTDAADASNGNRVLFQSGLEAAGTQFTYRVDTGANAANLNLKKKDKATTAMVRRMVVRIYYIASCSVCTGGGADNIPTLKVRELAGGPAWASAITIAEGIENLQIDYGMDTNNDGAADGVDATAITVVPAASPPTNWANAMSVKINMLVRTHETSPGYQDTKTYSMGEVGTVGATNDGYKRHVFMQSVRLVNPSARRVP